MRSAGLQVCWREGGSCHGAFRPEGLEARGPQSRRAWRNKEGLERQGGRPTGHKGHHGKWVPVALPLTPLPGPVYLPPFSRFSRWYIFRIMQSAVNLYFQNLLRIALEVLNNCSHHLSLPVKSCIVIAPLRIMFKHFSVKIIADSSAWQALYLPTGPHLPHIPMLPFALGRCAQQIALVDELPINSSKKVNSYSIEIK